MSHPTIQIDPGATPPLFVRPYEAEQDHRRIQALESRVDLQASMLDSLISIVSKQYDLILHLNGELRELRNSMPDEEQSPRRRAL